MIIIITFYTLTMACIKKKVLDLHCVAGMKTENNHNSKNGKQKLF